LFLGKKLSYPIFFEAIRLGLPPCLIFKRPVTPSAKLLKKQKGKCTHCGLFFREDDVMEVDHRIPKSQGGKDSYDNWKFLHRHCHDTKTAIDGSLGNQSGCNSAKPKPTRRLEKVDGKWVMRYA
jgi:RNA-directed DNA polymerase